MEVQFNNWIFRSYLFIVFICLMKNARADEDESNVSVDKNGRFLSMFEIVNFPNEACTGDAKNGTCYTSQECDNKKGTKDGDCASGYGVCCVFDVKCGAKSTENNTYFTASGSESSGTCSIQVCPGDNICQLRLDFDSFVINGPYTSTITAVGTPAVAITNLVQWGQVQNGASSGQAALLLNSQCYLDSFSVTSPGGESPPVICGTNSGEHMYVDATSSYCNTLGFALGASAAVSRSWTIRVSQYECDYNNLAPQGCTQYYFGQSTGTFRSYNYQSGKGYNLANQNQNICFRREKGNTKICYASAKFGDFDVSDGGGDGVAANAKGNVGLAKDGSCCGYGADGKKLGYDCLFIPSAVKVDGGQLGVVANKVFEGGFCGSGGLVSSNQKKSAETTNVYVTICSKRTPFMSRFVTDSFEYQNEAEKQQGVKGFELSYTLS